MRLPRSRGFCGGWAVLGAHEIGYQESQTVRRVASRRLLRSTVRVQVPGVPAHLDYP